MSQQFNRQSSGLVSQLVVILLLILTFTLIGFVAFSVVAGSGLGVGRPAGRLDNQRARGPTASLPQGTPDPSDTVNYKDTALGFSMAYPRTWRKQQQDGLQVSFAPAAEENTALWFGIPASGTVDSAEILGQIQVELAPNGQVTANGPLSIGGERWQSVQLSFEDEVYGPTIATIAATEKNQVGYYVVALAPADRWNQVQPTYRNILNSFQFTTEAVLRPTDATPPPTPTPTPTPVFHIVQSGDTLSHISVRYDVSIQAIMDRNGLDSSSIIRPGDKLIIPRPRRR
jgi:LysM repeat protein